ncbi:MAG: hypothetical protein KDA24_16910 [Deltaproteobacteria bacterium]|nr:hypothetical protein [Deltaproteobacteria bacterium]
MIVVFDLLWLLGAIPIYGVAGAAGGAVLWFAGQWVGWPWAMGFFPLAYFAFLFGIVGAVTVARLLIPREKEGTSKVFADRDFFVFLMHWMLESYVPPPLITHIQLLTFLRLAYFRGQGCKLSWSTHISPGARIWSAGLCEFGHLTYIGEFAHVTAHLSRGDKLLLAPVIIGDGVNVGAHANISPGCTIGSGVRIGPLVDMAPGCFVDDDAEVGPACQMGMGVHVGKGSKLEPRSFLDSWSRVPDGEVWAGDPAKKVGMVRPKRVKKKATASS